MSKLGAKNNVLVSATEPENLHNFTTLELTHINGTVAELIQLVPVPGKPGLYSGGPFVPPQEFFYLGVSKILLNFNNFLLKSTKIKYNLIILNFRLMVLLGTNIL